MQSAGIRWDMERGREVGIRIIAVVCNYAFLISRQPRSPRSPRSMGLLRRVIPGVIFPKNRPRNQMKTQSKFWWYKGAVYIQCLWSALKPAGCRLVFFCDVAVWPTLYESA